MFPGRAASDVYEFGKRHDCPSSETLLAYAGKSLPGLTRERIRLHLLHCDFCVAELRLLGKHPPLKEAAFVPARVPLWLLLLAEQSLPKSHVLKRPLRRHAA